eukprot:TRINITY_DN49971_c0_g1_i1.p1 TRINITY_DN49971_c0_g1~~TRINITY_DN49971_c0_g1_i1.p1  ORF type:complete len:550 (+),score=120.15 TRINITY_DN49971_c0_g1_i1:98-1651(+)
MASPQVARSLYRKLLKGVRAFDTDPAYRALLVAPPRQAYDPQQQRWTGVQLQDQLAEGRAAVNAAIQELNGGMTWWIPNGPGAGAAPAEQEGQLPRKGPFGQYVTVCFREGRIPGKPPPDPKQPPPTAAGLNAAFAALRVLAKVREAASSAIPDPIKPETSQEPGDLVRLTHLPQGVDCSWGITDDTEEVDDGALAVSVSTEPAAAAPAPAGPAEPAEGAQAAEAGGPPAGGARILLAHPLMDGFFQKTVLVIGAHRNGEATAWIVNRPLVARKDTAGRRRRSPAAENPEDMAAHSDLLRLKDLIPADRQPSAAGPHQPGALSQEGTSMTELIGLLSTNPVFCGGPVAMGAAGPGINMPASLRFIHPCRGVAGALNCGGGLYVDGDPAALCRQLADGVVSPSDFLVVLGYSGWSEDQLTGEIEQGSWIVCRTDDAVPIAMQSQRKVQEAAAAAKGSQLDDAAVATQIFKEVMAQPENAWRLCLTHTEDPDSGSATRQHAVAQLARLENVNSAALQDT